MATVAEDQPNNLVEVKKKGFGKLVQVAKQRKLEDLYRFLYICSFEIKLEILMR